MSAKRETTWVECGRAGKPFGIRGEVFVDWCAGECPVAAGGTVYVNEGGEYVPKVVCSSRAHGGRHVMLLEHMSSRDDAERLRGATFFLPEDELAPLSDGEYYSYQILGLEVVTDEGERLGTITKIFTAGAHDVYEVTDTTGLKPREILIPAIDQVIENIDLKAKKMTIKKLRGLW
jgi:16S rRNA processing protein RimM